MRKLPLFVLAAATALSIASVPMTAHAATFQVVGGGNGMNGYMTNCGGQTGNLANMLNQLGAGTGSRGSLGCGLGQNLAGNGSCSYGQGCADNGSCGYGQGCADNGSCGFGQSCSGNQNCTNGQSCGGNQNSGMNGQNFPFMMMR